MTKLLVNFTRKIVYLLWLQNSGIIIPVNVIEKCSKNSFKIRRWQRYCSPTEPSAMTIGSEVTSYVFLTELCSDASLEVFYVNYLSEVFYVENR